MTIGGIFRGNYCRGVPWSIVVEVPSCGNPLLLPQSIVVESHLAETHLAETRLAETLSWSRTVNPSYGNLRLGNPSCGNQVWFELRLLISRKGHELAESNNN